MQKCNKDSGLITCIASMKVKGKKLVKLYIIYIYYLYIIYKII